MTRPLAGMVVASTLFGAALTGTKYALGGFDPYTLLAVSLVAATVALWVVLLRTGYRAPRSWRLILVLGLLEPGFAYLAETYGLSRTTASAGALITGLESAFTVLLAALVLRERITRIAGIAITLALLGMALLEGGRPWGGSSVGNMCIALGVLSASAYTVVVKRWSDDTAPLALTAHQFLVATVLVCLVAGLRWSAGGSSLPTAVPVRFWAAAVLVGVLGYGASFLLFNSLIDGITAGTAAIVLNLIPAFGVITAVAWLGESMSVAMLLGASLIAASVVAFVVSERRSDRLLLDMPVEPLLEAVS